MPAISRMSVDHAITAQVQHNFIGYFRIFAGLPGITYVEEDMIWTASNGPPGDGGLVLGTQLSSEQVKSWIDETLRRIGRHSDTVDWMVFPGCRPIDLSDRLIERGEAGGPNAEWMLYGDIGGPGGNWMWANLNEMPESTPVPDGFHVRQVTDQAMLEEWVEINARGFGSSDYGAFHAAYARHGFGEDAQAVHFIGYVDGEPVTSSTLLMAGGSASVYNVSTPENLRRQGYGGAITRAALQHAIERGYTWTWIWSSSLGKSVYEKLGFVVADFGIREYQWKKRQ